MALIAMLLALLATDGMMPPTGMTSNGMMPPNGMTSNGMMPPDGMMPPNI